MPSDKALIINADDFGFSKGVTDGIVQAFKSGVLTSTTLMTTMPDRDRAIDLAKANRKLGVGVQLSLTLGKPFTNCDAILNKDGNFPTSLPRLFLRMRSEDAVAQAVEEWSAQVDFALKRGIVPTHLSSHQHVHHMPGLQEVIIAVAKRYNIKYVRAAREAAIDNLPSPGFSYLLLTRLARMFAYSLPNHGMGTTNWFFGLSTPGKTDVETWKTLIANCPKGLGEIMVHPGDPAGLTPDQTRLVDQRKVELDALCHPEVKKALDAAGIVLTHFGKLPEPEPAPAAK